ncbi:MAG: hypothetical protein C0624_04085 [Desulfuromonas sp.]|nr:MAG: hypothetical protein C0624_04085 [Desulfuromonas sp.]
MRKVHLIITAALAAVMIMSSGALAAGQIKLETIVEREILVDTPEGKQVSYLATNEVEPGDTLRITLSYSNTGDETADDVKLDNPIPEGTEYIVDSATSVGVESLLFSIDKGATYQSPTLLTYEVSNVDGSIEKRIASAGEYTHIRWMLSPVEAGSSGSVSFNVRVK